MDPVTMMLLMGGLQGASSLFGGAEDPQQLEPYAPDPEHFLDPRRMLAQNVRDTAQFGSILARRAAQDVTLPGAFVQPSAWYGGGGLPIPMGRTGMDPALFQPQKFLSRRGVQFAQPDFPGPEPGATWVNEQGGTVPDIARRIGLPQNMQRLMFGADPIDLENAYRGELERVRSSTALSSLTQAEWDTWVQDNMRPDFNTLAGPQGGGYAPRRIPAPFPRVDPATGEMAAMPGPDVPAGWNLDTRGPQMPGVDVGGGIPQLRANLELLGVQSDPSTGQLRQDQREPGWMPDTGTGDPGYLTTPQWAPDWAMNTMGGVRQQNPWEIGNQAMFTGDINPRRQAPAGPQPGTGLDQPQWSRRRDPGSFT
jgi:hypothetical protein